MTRFFTSVLDCGALTHGIFPGSSGEDAKSRWDQIRTAQQTTKPTSWDSIRETHEKQRMGRSGTPSSSAASDNGTVPYKGPRDAEREAEQAKFDALLEGERRIAAQDGYSGGQDTRSYGAEGDVDASRRGGGGGANPLKRWT